MTEGPSSGSEQLTVLVFKDNFAARTFRVPLKWITRFGLILGLILGTTALSSYFALQYFLVYKKTDMVRVQELEREFNLLKSQTKDQATEISEEAKLALSLPLTPAQPLAAELVGQEAHPATAIGNSNLFSPIVPPLHLQTPDPKDLSFAVKGLKTYWEKDSLFVEFFLQYTKEDQGNQQGRILIFARGPGLLVGYPRAALDPAHNSHFLSPKGGEIFSVSRFRQVKASFGPFPSHDVLSGVEIFIFNKNGTHLLNFHKTEIPVVAPTEPIEQDKNAQHS